MKRVKLELHFLFDETHGIFLDLLFVRIPNPLLIISSEAAQSGREDFIQPFATGWDEKVRLSFPTALIALGWALGSQAT